MAHIGSFSEVEASEIEKMGELPNSFHEWTLASCSSSKGDS